MSSTQHVREILVASQVYLCAMMGAILYSAIATTPTDYFIVFVSTLAMVLCMVSLAVVLCVLHQSESESVVAMVSTSDMSSSSATTSGTSSLV